jgi:hypothetical protein
VVREGECQLCGDEGALLVVRRCGHRACREVSGWVAAVAVAVGTCLFFFYQRPCGACARGGLTVCGCVVVWVHVCVGSGSASRASRARGSRAPPADRWVGLGRHYHAMVGALIGVVGFWHASTAPPSQDPQALASTFFTHTRPHTQIPCPVCAVPERASALTLSCLRAMGLGGPTSLLITGIRQCVLCGGL